MAKKTSKQARLNKQERTLLARVKAKKKKEETDKSYFAQEKRIEGLKKELATPIKKAK